MKDCYHTTKTTYLSEILKNGLQPKHGSNSSLTAETRNNMISYSVGLQGLVDTFSVFDRFYNSVSEGNINEEMFRKSLSLENYEAHKQSVKSIQEAESFKDWIKDNIYLCFDGNCLNQKNEDKIEDAYTSQTIFPEQLQVCVIKEKGKDEIYSYSMLDIYSLCYAKNSQLEPRLCTWRYRENIDKFKDDKYYLEYIDLSKFCEVYPELLENKTSTKILLQNELHNNEIKQTNKEEIDLDR